MYTATTSETFRVAHTVGSTGLGGQVLATATVSLPTSVVAESPSLIWIAPTCGVLMRNAGTGRRVITLLFFDTLSRAFHVTPPKRDVCTGNALSAVSIPRTR